ncbi:MAG TPA: ATP-binding protein [Acidimicrobiales bacterium]|jgi:serine/threonine-protein kinase RsbW|nr:ATP-binding protein [Acidimicrobiales bacterium]
MEINMALLLPRDARTVPVARHICREALRELGVEADCVADIEVALTEACTNVLEHSRAGEEYEVQVRLAERDCIIRVVDQGQGFDADAPVPRADDSAESGRGIALMRALVDHVKFESRPQDGTVVRLQKQLLYADGAPVTTLSVWRRQDGSE